MIYDWTIDYFTIMQTLLLHTCCAPCSAAIIEWLLANDIRPTLFYCNPNIYPREEYDIRKAECTRYARSLGLDIVDADYDHEAWLAHMKGLEDEPERGRRCLQCFRLRLTATARYAHEHGGIIALEEPGTDSRSRTGSRCPLPRRGVLGQELAQGRTDRTPTHPPGRKRLLQPTVLRVRVQQKNS